MKVIKIVLLILIPQINYADQLGNAINYLTREIGEELSQRGNDITLAIKNFRGNRNESIEYQIGMKVTERLMFELTQLWHFNVIKLEEALDEMELYQSGVIGSEDLLRIGKSLGADAIINGVVHGQGAYYKVNVQVLDVKTGDIIFSDEINFEMGSKYAIGAVFRSLILPGWGQIYIRKKTKGRLIMTAEVGLVATAAFMYFRNKGAGENMKTASTLEEISKYYNEASQSHQIHYVCICAAIGIWIYSIIDVHASALSSENDLKHVTNPNTGRLTLLADNQNNNITLKVQYGIPF